MKRYAAPLLVCVIGACALVIGRAVVEYRNHVESRQQTAAAAPARALSLVEQQYGLEWKWRTEHEWIVSDVIASVANMAAFARTGAAPASAIAVTEVDEQLRLPSLARFEIAAPPREYLVVEIVDHLWDPAAYAAAGAKLLGGERGTCTSSNDPAMIDALATPVLVRLLAENDRISERLQRDIRCAAAHEEAALLLGAFAMREAGGAFSDTRRLISRMTAHLAIARALGGEPAPAGRLANVVLLTLVGRQQSVLDALPALESDATPGMIAWVRALRFRNSFDWRVAADARVLSPLEQRERIRAMALALRDESTLDILREADDGESVDWPRAALEATAGVIVGNVYTDQKLTRELQEIVRAGAAFNRTIDISNADSLAAALNVEPEPGPVSADGRSVRVIDWGTWAAASQRQLLKAVVARQWHLAASLGTKTEAAEFRTFSRQQFAKLRLYPLAARYTGGTKEIYYSAMAEAIEICRTRPELVTDGVWKRLLEKTEDGPVPEQMPPSVAWFKPFFPAGTAYDYLFRAYAINQLPRLTYEDLSVVRQRAPYVRTLIDASVKYHYPNGATYDELQREYGHMAAYEVTAAWKITNAARNDPARFAELIENVATMDPEALRTLGSYFADRGRDDDAQRTYERYIASARNSIAVSAGSYWLVRHYFLRGEHARATALADRAADVYSYYGLITRADLHDWRGETRQAEAYYRRAAERYDEASELAAFYLRHGRTGEEPARLLRNAFPDGMQRVSFPSLTAAPAQGVLLKEVGCAGEGHGLRNRDIVVAVDGILVRSYNQYRVARGAKRGDRMLLTVWRNGRYLEVATDLRYVWTESYLEDYPDRRLAE